MLTKPSCSLEINSGRRYFNYSYKNFVIVLYTTFNKLKGLKSFRYLVASFLVERDKKVAFQVLRSLHLLNNSTTASITASPLFSSLIRKSLLENLQGVGPYLFAL